jgi:hypothetical protein
MNKSIYITLAWLVFAGSAQAISLSVPKGLIDIAVAKKFPKEKFNLVEVQSQFFDHFVYGLCTDKGRKLYQK